MSTSLMNLDCSWATTENLAICFFFLIQYGNSVVLVTLTAIFLSNIVHFEWDLSVSAIMTFTTCVTVPVVFHCGGWSTKAMIVFAVIRGIVRVL